MATVHSSPEVVRQIKSDLSRTVKELEEAGNKVRVAVHHSSEWSDVQGEQYRALMQQIGRLIESPIEPLRSAQPKLEKLAQSLDAYGSVRF